MLTIVNRSNTRRLAWVKKKCSGKSSVKDLLIYATSCRILYIVGWGFLKDKTELYVDAYPVGLGAILAQRDNLNMPRIISFAFKGLTKTKGISSDTTFTDHETLEYIFEEKHQAGKLACCRGFTSAASRFLCEIHPGNWQHSRGYVHPPFDEAAVHHKC